MARTMLAARRPAASNTTPSGVPQGTLGGKPRAAGVRPGKKYIAPGDEVYLWILVLIEATVIGLFRVRIFRRHHGG